MKLPRGDFMAQIKKHIEEYEKKFGKPFPVLYFEYMRSFDDSTFTDAYIINIINTCIKNNVEYTIIPSESYDLYVAEAKYFEKFGVDSSCYRMLTSERINILMYAIERNTLLETDDLVTEY